MNVERERVLVNKDVMYCCGLCWCVTFCVLQSGLLIHLQVDGKW